MKNSFKYALLLLLMTINLMVISQNLSIKKQGNKYGVWKFSEAIIPPVYDTILPFDSTSAVCLACVKSQKPGNKFIKTNNMILMCKYLNNQNESLIIKLQKDTCAYFPLNKHCYESYGTSKNNFVVQTHGKKYVVNKQFRQLTFNGYDEIIPTPLPNYFVVHNITLGASYLEGLINEKEELIVPFEYSSIKTNPYDSLFMGCTAQLKTNGNDDVFKTNGKKIHTYSRHIECATPNFIIHKIFIPQEHYVILNLKSNKEKNIYAEEIVYLGNDSIAVTIKGKTHMCNLFELDTYKFLNHEKH